MRLPWRRISKVSSVPMRALVSSTIADPGRGPAATAKACPVMRERQRRPLGRRCYDAALTEGGIRHVGSGGGEDACFDGRIGTLAAAHAFEPVGDVEQLAIRIGIEIRAARTGAEDHLLRRNRA